jgi:hypothetical protein
MEGTIVETDCSELKNIKYKTLLLNGVPLPESKSANDLSNLDKFLEKEKNTNNNEPWCKLNKTSKIKKIQEYVETYKTKNNLTDQESLLLLSFLKDSLDRKKLLRVKDVIYDKENSVILDIPALCYIKTSKHFTLKNMDKRISTLKSLTPKKNQGTFKRKEKITDDSDSEENDEF